jgi:hypothetical protein
VHRISLLIAVFVALGPRAVFGQTPPRLELHARHVSAGPTIDGILDDEAWSDAPLALESWVSYNPMRGQPAQEETRVWVVHDDRAIYIAFRCLDSQPDKIRTTISRRDNVFPDDWVGMSLDSSGAGQLAYHLFVNPSGIQMDALNSGSSEDFAPDWVWQSAGRIGEDGWTAEIRVPLENLRFRSGDEVRMGVLFYRRLSRAGVSWSWPEMRPGNWVLESNADLVFDRLQSRRLFEAIPSATFSNRLTEPLAATFAERDSRGDFGASIKYGLTSSVALDATVNPDFSQVESDAFEVEINTRFPVFFSEKRPFFMEGINLFNLAGTGGDASMRTAVHTRRIIDPSAGIKITGALGRHTFGVLSSPDTSPEGSEERYFTIGRHVLNVGQGEYFGVLATDTELAGEHNRVIGGDFALRHGQRFRWNGSLLSSHSRSLSGEDQHGLGTQLTYAYSTRRLDVSGQVEHYDRGFRMDTAFLNRVGMTRGWQFQGLNFYPSPERFGWIKRINPFVWMTRARDRVQGGTEAFVLGGWNWNFTRAGFLRLELGRGHETFVGQQFDTGRQGANGNIQILRWLNIGGSWSSGPAIFYDPVVPFQGDRTQTNVRFNLQPNARLNSSTSYNFVSFTNRSTGLEVFDAHVVNLRNTYQFTPQFLIRAVAQYDSSQKRVLSDFLASYELTPGTVVHAGYGALFERDVAVPYKATARALFLKASYLARF